MLTNSFRELFEDKESSNLQLFNPSLGLRNGNLYPQLYQQFENYQPSNLTSSSKQENLLQEIMEYSFALQDLLLYLDIHPDDYQTYLIFKEYSHKLNELTTFYEEKYTCLNAYSSKFDQVFTWVKH
jgi:hypothetical protein